MAPQWLCQHTIMRSPGPAGAKAVDVDLGFCQSDCAYVQGCPVTLHVVAQPLWNGEHPLAHRQTRKDVILQVRRDLHNAEVLHEGHTPRPLQK